MLIEISNGELLDKLTILEIKLAEIKDKVKLVNIQKEFDTLNPLAKELFDNNDGQLQNLYLELASINSQLWDIEDRIRECEKAKRFDKEFIELARSVYITNDRRSEIKKIINVTTGSNLVEEKSYEEYKN